MSKRPKPFNASVIAGLSCTVIGFVGCGYFAAVACGWIPRELREPIGRIVVGTTGIAITAAFLWFGIRWLNRRGGPEPPS